MGSSENSPVQRLLHVPPQVVHRDTLPAVRIAISVGIPLLMMLALGEPRLTIFTAFGAFASLYGRMQPLRGRMIQQGASGVLMTLCVWEWAWPFRRLTWQVPRWCCALRWCRRYALTSPCS